MWSYLEQILQELYQQQTSEPHDSNKVSSLKWQAKQWVHAAPPSSIKQCGKDIVRYCVQIGFSELIEMVLKAYSIDDQDEVLLYKKENAPTNWELAILGGSKEVIQLYTKYYSNKASLFSCDLQEAIVKNDTPKAKSLLENISPFPETFDVLECAIGLNNMELVQLLWEKKTFQSRFNVKKALDVAIDFYKKEITNYLIEQLFIQNRMDILNQIFNEANDENKRSRKTWLITLYINQLSKHAAALSMDEKIALITIPLKFVLGEALYDTTLEFQKNVDSILSIVAKDHKKVKSHIKKMVLDLISSQPEGYDAIIWTTFFCQQQNQNQIQIYTTKTIIDVKQFIMINQLLKISFYEKLLCHPYFSCQNIFANEIDTQTKWLKDAILHRKPLAFRYFLTPSLYSYENANQNNLAHMAVQHSFDIGVYTLFQSKSTRSLFNNVNKNGARPLEIVETMPYDGNTLKNILSTLMNPKWKIYHDLKSKWISPEFFQHTKIHHDQFGTVSTKTISHLNQLKRLMPAINQDPIKLLKLGYSAVNVALFYELSEELFHTLKILWSNSKCSHAITELLVDYVCVIRLMNTIALFLEINLIMSFLRFDKNASYIAIIEDILKRTVSNPALNEIHINLKFILFSLYVSKLFTSDTDFYLPLHNSRYNHISLCQTITARLLAATPAPVAHPIPISEPLLTEFVNHLEKLDSFNVPQMKLFEIPNFHESYLHLLDAHLIGLNWIVRFFSGQDQSDEKTTELLSRAKKLLLKQFDSFLDEIDISKMPSPTSSSESSNLVSLTEQFNGVKLKFAEIKKQLQTVTNPVLQAGQPNPIPTDINDFPGIPSIPSPASLSTPISKPPSSFEFSDLKTQLIISLKRLKHQVDSQFKDQTAIAFETNIATRLMKLMPIDTVLENYKTGQGNDNDMISLFVGSNFKPAFEYLALHGKKQFFEKLPPNRICNPFETAIFCSATDVIDFYLEHTADVDVDAQLFDENEFKKAIFYNDIEKAKKIQETMGCFFYQDRDSNNPLAYAIRLKKLEFIKLLSINKNFITNFTLSNVALTHSKEIFDYFLDLFIQAKECVSLQENITVMCQKTRPNNDLIELCVGKIARSAFKINERIQLISPLLIYVLKTALYSTEKEFRDQFKLIKNASDDKEYKKQINQLIKITIKDHQRWGKEVPGKMAFSEKIHYLDLSPKDIFTPKECSVECTKLLIEAIKKKDPLLFHYFLKYSDLNYHDHEQKNLAQIAIEAECNQASFVLFHSNPKLFKDENTIQAVAKHPNSRLQIFLSKNSETYRNTEIKFLSHSFYYFALIEDPLWGKIPRGCAECLTQIKNYISILKSRLEKKDVHAEKCYLRIRDIFFTTFLFMQPDHRGRVESIVQLLNDYNELGKHEQLSQTRTTIHLRVFISLFSCYGAHQKSLELANELLAFELENRSLKFSISYIRLTILGLHASRMMNTDRLAKFYPSPTEIQGSIPFDPLKTIIFRFVASNETACNLPIETCIQFQKEIEQINFSDIKMTDQEVDKTILTYSFESFDIFLDWIHFFSSLPKDTRCEPQKETAILKLKLVLLEKLKSAFGPMHAMTLMEDVFKHKANEFRKQLDSDIETTTKSINDLSPSSGILAVTPHHEVLEQNMTDMQPSPDQPHTETSTNIDIFPGLMNWLTFNLQKIITHRFLPHPNHDVINIRKRIVSTLVELIPTHLLLNMRNAIDDVMADVVYSKHIIFINYILDPLFKQKQVDALLKNLKTFSELDHSPLQTYFWPLYFDKLKHSELSLDDIIKLLEIPLKFILQKSVYSTEKEFRDQFKLMRELSPNELYKKPFNALLRDIIRECIFDSSSPHPNPDTQEKSLSFSEKLHYLDISSKELFLDEADHANLLLNAIQGKNPLLFFYFIKGMDLSQRYLHNAIHFVIHFSFATGANALLKLFEKNHAEKRLSNSLITLFNPKKNPCFKPDDPLHQNIQTGFAAAEYHYDAVIEHPTWGCVPRQCAEYLTKIEYWMSSFKSTSSNTEPPQKFQNAYKALCDYLIQTIETLRPFDCKTESIVPLLNDVYHFGKENNLFADNLPTKMFISFFSHFNSHEKAFELAEKLLSEEIKKPDPQEFEINYLRLIVLGLSINKTINPPLSSTFTLHTLQDRPINKMAKTILFRFALSFDAMQNVSEEACLVLQKNIQEIDCSHVQTSGHQEQQKDDLLCCIETFGIFLHWVQSLEMMELKMVLLEKLKQILLALYTEIKTTSSFHLSLISTLDSYSKYIEDALHEPKPEPKKVLSKLERSLYKPAPSRFDVRPSEESTQKVLGRLKPSLHHRFFITKHESPYKRVQAKVLDLVCLADHQYDCIEKPYRDMFVELAGIWSRYLKLQVDINPNISPEYVQFFEFIDQVNIATISYTPRVYKQFVSQFIKEILSEHETLLQLQKQFTENKERLTSALYAMQKLEPISMLFTEDQLTQYHSQKEQYEKELNLINRDLNTLEIKLTYLLKYSKSVSRAQDMLQPKQDNPHTVFQPSTKPEWIASSQSMQMEKRQYVNKHATHIAIITLEKHSQQCSISFLIGRIAPGSNNGILLDVASNKRAMDVLSKHGFQNESCVVKFPDDYNLLENECRLSGTEDIIVPLLPALFTCIRAIENRQDIGLNLDEISEFFGINDIVKKQTMKHSS